MNNFKNYIFDLDGTLINSSNEVLLCFKKAFAQANYPIDEKNLTSDIIGPPLNNIIKLIAPNINEQKTQDVTKYFRQIYDYDENDISVVYDGFYEILNHLKQINSKLFIATLKPYIPTKRVLQKFNLADFFDDIYTIDKFEGKYTKEQMVVDIITKYNLDKQSTVMAGDAKGDIIAGKNAGVKTIAALWGYGTNKEDIVNEADYNFKTPKDLFKWLK